jgi:hypothetical protein
MCWGSLRVIIPPSPAFLYGLYIGRHLLPVNSAEASESHMELQVHSAVFREVSLTVALGVCQWVAAYTAEVGMSLRY